VPFRGSQRGSVSIFVKVKNDLGCLLKSMGLVL
jgi:hypothetical protein